MADNGELPAWAVGIGGFITAIGTVLAAIFKGRKRPESESEMEALRLRVSELERRQNDCDKRFERVFDLLAAVDNGLGKCQADVREALARLDERRQKT